MPVNVGLEGVGIAERAYQHALWYARERVQGAIIGDKSGEKSPSSITRMCVVCSWT